MERFKRGLVLFRCGYSDLVPLGSNREEEIDRCFGSRIDLYGLGGFVEHLVQVRDDVIVARRDVVESVGAVVVGECAATEFNDQDIGPVQRAASFPHRNRSGQSPG